jgi:hypothetical protein
MTGEDKKRALERGQRVPGTENRLAAAKWCAVLLVTLPALLVAAAAYARPLTTAPPSVVNIHVTITNTNILVDRHSAPRGVEAHFIIRNTGTSAHNFTLRGVFSRTVKPHQQTIVRLFLDYRARLPYLGGLPADRGKPGMRGFFVIS